MPATARPDLGAVRTTVQRALAQGPLPRYSDLEEMEAQLRGLLAVLLPRAEAAGVDGAVLRAVRGHLADGMGSGLMSARNHVRQLAQDVQAFARYMPGVGGE